MSTTIGSVPSQYYIPRKEIARMTKMETSPHSFLDKCGISVSPTINLDNTTVFITGDTYHLVDGIIEPEALRSSLSLELKLKPGALYQYGLKEYPISDRLYIKKHGRSFFLNHFNLVYDIIQVGETLIYFS